jgi:hypothetical protein
MQMRAMFTSSMALAGQMTLIVMAGVLVMMWFMTKAKRAEMHIALPSCVADVAGPLCVR